MKPITKALTITITAILSLYVLVSLVLLVFSARTALEVQDQAFIVLSTLEEGEYERAFVELRSISTNLQRAQRLQRPSGWLRYFPMLNSDYIVYEELLAAGTDLSTSVQFIVDQLLQTTISQSLSFDSIDLKTAPKAYLEVHPQVMKAIAHLETAAIESQNLHIELFPEPIQATIETLQMRLQEFNERIGTLKPFLEQLPTVLGANQPQEMLVLLQNPHELRPTGGFIGSFARIGFDQGELQEFFTEDVYNVDVFALGREELEAPQPIQQYTEVDYWYFRDSNWSPDFPTAAQQAMELYEFQTNEEGITTLVAMTPYLVEEFLRLTGPIEVGGITFDKTNLIDALQFRVEQEFWRIGLSDEERKSIINDLAQALRQRVFTLSTDELFQFLTIIQDALDRKEILVYTTNPELQELVVSRSWAGQIRDEKSDFLAIFDANLGALKTDRLVERNHEYKVRQQEDGSLTAELTIRYKNNGFFDYRTTRYRTYTRIYVPLGSQLLSSTGFVTTDKSSAYVEPEVFAEFDKTVFAGFVSVEPGQERFARITYTLPPWLSQKIVNEQKYELLIQKQPGVPPIETETAFTFTQPLFSLAPSSVEYTVENENALIFTDYPQQDTLYTIKLNP